MELGLGMCLSHEHLLASTVGCCHCYRLPECTRHECSKRRKTKTRNETHMINVLFIKYVENFLLAIFSRLHIFISVCKFMFATEEFHSPQIFMHINCWDFRSPRTTPRSGTQWVRSITCSQSLRMRFEPLCWKWNANIYEFLCCTLQTNRCSRWTVF